MHRAVAICRDLVRIPSVNPDGDAGTEETGEQRMAEWVGAFCAQLGAEVSYDEVLPGRPNVIARFPTNGSGSGKPRIVLGPHTDTVSVTGMTIDPFGGELRDGRLYGRGACDTKGTMAAMLAALEELGPEGVARLGAEVTFVGFMGEETGQWGSKHFAKHHTGYDFALVGEPTECKVVHTHKGSWWLTLHTTGVAVHGSMPEKGENAILKMLPVLKAVDQEWRPALAVPAFRHAVLGDSTVNIGTIRGGARTNIVPDACAANLDIRFTPGLHRHGLEAMLAEFLAVRGWSDSVRVESLGLCAPLDTAADHPLVQKLAAAGNGLTGAPWFCDAAWLSAAGIPAVAAGPGSIAQAHTADEWVSLAELEKGTDFYRRFLESL